MDREHIKGATEKAKDAVKDPPGRSPATRSCKRSTKPKTPRMTQPPT